MIARVWRGRTRTTDREAYASYVRETGCEAQSGTRGNRGSLILQRDGKDGLTEIVVLSFWATMESVRAFAGPEPEVAVYFPEDDRYLLEKPKGVTHYEITAWVNPE